MDVTAYWLAERWIGTRELPGANDNPFVLGMLRLDSTWPSHDEVAWCSAFANFIAWQLRLPRSKSLAARSWLKVGTPIGPHDAEPGFDVVILKRGANSPGPETLDAPGHVGFFGRIEGSRIWVLGGNQSDGVSLASFPVGDIIGIRRLANE